MPTPTWATSLSTTVTPYPISKTLNVQAKLKLTQRILTIEENKAPAPYKTAGYYLSKIATTTEEQNSAIRVAFHNEDTMPKETEIQDAIGKKMPNLIKPRNEPLVRPTADLLKAYATEGFPENFDLEWSTDHIEATLRRGPHPSENSFAATAALHAETAEKIKNGYAKVVQYGYM